MAKGFNLTVICGAGMGIVAIDNVRAGKDPIPAAVAGFIFTGAVVFIENMDEDLATALAWLFLISVLLRRGSTVVSVMTAFANADEPVTDGSGGSAEVSPAPKKPKSHKVPKYI